VNGFVLDASVALAWCFRDEKSPQAVRVLDRIATGERVLVTALWWYEVLNALLYAERRNRITEALTRKFLSELDLIRVVCDTVESDVVLNATQTWCRRHALTAYDAAYLELALRGSYPMATLDDDLRRAALAEKLTIL
jgi:predicted nucleic acid-binding protein